MKKSLLIVHFSLVTFIGFLGLSAAEKPNILFLLADDQRPDTIGALGNPRIETPNLDRLVARGMTFTRATCSYPICVVTGAEILTGMHGWENGVNGYSGSKFNDGVTFWENVFFGIDLYADTYCVNAGGG